jgi:hypothetical protein
MTNPANTYTVPSVSIATARTGASNWLVHKKIAEPLRSAASPIK